MYHNGNSTVILNSFVYYAYYKLLHVIADVLSALRMAVLNCISSYFERHDNIYSKSVKETCFMEYIAANTHAYPTKETFLQTSAKCRVYGVTEHPELFRLHRWKTHAYNMSTTLRYNVFQL